VARLPEEKNNIKYKIEDGKRGKEIWIQCELWRELEDGTVGCRFVGIVGKLLDDPVSY
jgi:hypothetical protein